MQLFALQDFNHLDYFWIIVICFYQLFGLSFWRHPFTAEDLLVSKWRNAKFIQICSSEKKKKNVLDGMRLSTS